MSPLRALFALLRVLALIEAAMPLPLIDCELDEVWTESRALH
jgi:hypothetical protein